MTAELVLAVAMTAELVLAVGQRFLFLFAAILPILNPAATAPIFPGLTEGASAGTRALPARRIARNTYALMVGSMLSGTYVLELFGISLPIVRVVGGLIVAAAAWWLLDANHAIDDPRAPVPLVEPDLQDQGSEDLLDSRRFEDCRDDCVVEVTSPAMSTSPSSSPQVGCRGCRFMAGRPQH